MNLENIDAIIFDLGGVLINLDYQKTEAAFVQLGSADFKKIYSQLSQTDLFDRFETGKISPFHFINRLLDQLPKGTNANQVVHAWNSMILDFPEKRMKWLEEIGSKKRVFLLSNTNELHVTAVRFSLKKSIGHENLESYFEKTYFSNELGLRKPNPECFEAIIKENDLNPSRTLFIDDSPQHIEGAKSVGLQTFYLEKGLEVMDIFDK